MKTEIPEVFYKTLFDNADDGMLIVDLVTKKFLECNKSISQMLGWSQDEIKIKLKIPDIHPAKDLPYVLSQFERQARGKLGENIIAENMPVLRRDGSVFYADITASRANFDGKECMLGIFRDITERRKAEEELKESKAKEEALLMSIGDGVVAVDKVGKIILVNKIAEELLGRSRQELIGLLCDEIPLFDETGAIVKVEERPLNQVLSSGISIRKTYTNSPYYCSRKDKTIFPIAFTVTPVIFGNEVIGAIKIFRDITHEKEIDKAKSEFISLASHQLRSPTTAINWYAEMLLGNDVGALNEKQREYLQEIHFGNQRMIDLVNALLSISRIEMGTFAVQSEPMDIIVEVESVLRELATQIKEKNLVIEKKYQQPAIGIESDPKLVRIIFQNLLSNAVTYTLPKGKITLVIKDTNVRGLVQIEVADTGCGIPVANQNKVFQKFYRADNAQTIKPDGNGLGLYITKAIVQALGGNISFKSEEGRGTTFSLTIQGRGIAKKESDKKSN